MRQMVTDVQHRYDDQNLQSSEYMMQAYMSWICMRGLKYDASRHIKRTWVYFVPGKNLDYSKVDTGDLVPVEDACDWTNVIVDGQRDPEKLKEYYRTNLQGLYMRLSILA